MLNTNEDPVELLTEFIYESNAIENTYIDHELIARQIISNKKIGHVGALLLLESKISILNTYVTKDLICEIQRLIIDEQARQRRRGTGNDMVMVLPVSLIGAYRRCPVSINGKLCLAWPLIESKMEDLLRRIRWFQENERNLDTERKINEIADFHFSFEKIHPFVNGSGRTGRALVWFLLKYSSIQPFIFTSEDRRYTYYPCFESDNSRLMRQYFMGRLGYTTVMTSS